MGKCLTICTITSIMTNKCFEKCTGIELTCRRIWRSVWDKRLSEWKQRHRPRSCPVIRSTTFQHSNTSFPTECILDLSGMWHALLEEGTSECLHRASSAEQPAQVSHFVRTATLCSRLIMRGTLYWRVSLNEVNAENETKPEMIACQWHNTPAHFRTGYKGKVHLSLFQLASLYYNCFWRTCRSL